MKHIAEKLEAEMARAVSIMVAASHAAALEALSEGFGVDQHQSERRAGGRPQRATIAPATPRRSRAQMRALEEQLLQEVCATPGESMSVLAPRVGALPSQLQVPVARLKAARKLRAVGERQYTRYFPVEHGAGDGSDVADR